MRPLRRRLFLVMLAALAVVLTAASAANAVVVTKQDAQGRAIRFDVRAATADVDWYAAVLSSTAHGNEISNVVIRIVPEPQIEGLCGNEAAACYTGRVAAPIIYVAAGKSAVLRSTLIHEYGHHLDSAWRVPGVPELNGTPAWWAARGMPALLAAGQVAFDYSLGWSHSVGEIFAEDYQYIHTGRTSAIRWLQPPSDALKAAMFAELGQPQGSLPEAPEIPSIYNRKGTLTPHDTRTMPFGLLAEGRRVTFTATVARKQRKGVRARAQVVCDGRVLSTKTFVRGVATRTIDLPHLGPADCDARLISNAGVKLSYTLRLRLAIETA
jgi:hypothetical protein